MPTAIRATEPRSRDADRSQALILLGARDEFANHGLAGARNDRVAAALDAYTQGVSRPRNPLREE